MKPPFILLVALLLITGCSSTQVYYRPDRNPQETYQDYNECRQQAIQELDPHGIGGFMPVFKRPNFSKETANLMRARGYDLVSVNSVANGTRYPVK